MHFTFAFYHFDAINNKSALRLKSLPGRQNDSNGRLQLLRNPCRLRGSQPSVEKKVRFFSMYFCILKLRIKRHEEKPRFFELWKIDIYSLEYLLEV